MPGENSKPAKSAPGKSRPSKRTAAKLPEIMIDPAEAAKAAGLRYTNDHQPGIHRIKRGKGFGYSAPNGGAVRDKETLRRIHSLVIPPAWTDVWITTHANGHLQATGRDARGRKQGRYHPRWRESRDDTKYQRMSLFADALPKIRAQVDKDLALPGLPRPKVLATIISLMENTLIRVGNVEYAKENKSYGLTTMRSRHVRVDGSHITFSFQGKSRVNHTIDLRDRRLAKIVQRCSDLPGYELFQYLDEKGAPHTIDSSDVNGYLREITGEHFTAKDFRTWAGSVLACVMLRDLEPYESLTQAKKNIVDAIKQVAAKLGNTPSVCRKCYVHPAVLEAYLGGITAAKAKAKLDKAIASKAAALKEDERALLQLLEQRLVLESKKK